VGSTPVGTAVAVKGTVGETTVGTTVTVEVTVAVRRTLCVGACSLVTKVDSVPSKGVGSGMTGAGSTSHDWTVSKKSPLSIR